MLPTEPSSAEACIGVRDNIMAYHLAIHHLALSKFYHIYINFKFLYLYSNSPVTMMIGTTKSLTSLKRMDK